MTNYSKTTNFTAKDSLVSGDANKIVKGSEIDTEFDNIATASATKANIASPAFTGVVSFPDGTAGDPSITNTGDTNTGLFFSAADTLAFSAAGTAQFTMADGAIAPVTDNDVDLGTSSLEFKDGYFDGTVYADAINFNGTAITATAAELNIMDGVTSTATEINLLDGVTATTTELNYVDVATTGTVEASKAIVVDSNKDFTGARNVTLTGELDASTLDIAGNGDIAGNLFIGNNLKLHSDEAVLGFGADEDVTLTHVADTGLLLNSTMALQFNDASQFINAPSATVLDINATDEIELNATAIDINGAVDISGNLDVGGNLVVTGTTTFNGGTLTLGDAASDNVVFGADVNSNIIPNTDNTYDLGSSSQEWKDLYVDGIAYLDGINFNGTAISATAAELNVLDGITAVVGELNALDLGSTAVGTAIASKAAILDSNKDYTGIRNFTITGELDAATLDISGDIDVDGTTNLDVVDIDGAVDMASTLAVGGVVTANAGVVVDNITIDGTEIDLSSGDLTIDVAGDIIFDADGGDFRFKDAGTQQFILDLDDSVNSVILRSSTADGDMVFQGNDSDGGGNFTALTLDMSAAGEATFNAGIKLGDGHAASFGAGGDLLVYHSSNENIIQTNTSDQDLLFKGNDSDGGGSFTALTLDMSAAGAATFNSTITAGAAIFDTSDNSDNLTLRCTDADANIGPVLTLNRNSASPADDDLIGSIEFDGRNDATQAVEYAQIISQIRDATDGTEDGALYLQTMVAGTKRERVTLLEAETVVNNAGVDLDFRVESDGNANMLFVDAANDRIGVGTNAPGTTLNLRSDTSDDGLLLEKSDGTDIARLFFDGTSTNARLDMFSSGSATVQIRANGDTHFSGGNVGIGTTPDSDSGLHLKGDGKRLFIDSNDYNLVSLGRAGSSGAALDTAYFRMKNAGTNKVIIHAGGDSFFNGGNVGFGQSSPATALDIGAAGVIRFRRSDDARYGELFHDNNGSTLKASSSGDTLTLTTAGGNLLLETPASYSIVVNEEGIDADFRVESDNNSNAILVDAGNDFICFGNSVSNPASGYADQAGVSIDLSASGPSQFSSDATPITVGRTSTGGHGDMIAFRQASNHFASIGSKVADAGTGTGELFIASGNTGLFFDDQSNFIRPCSSSAGTRDNIVAWGQSGSRFTTIFATTGTINTSDRNEKQDIEELSDAEQRVAVAAKGLLRKFRWKSSVEEKGDDARIHFGIIAQDLQDAFTAEGLDAARYAMFCSDTWTNEDGSEQTRLGVRYSELLAFIISAI